MFYQLKSTLRLNNIEIPEEEDDGYLNFIYDFVWDARFIDFAFDKSGIIFNERVYTLPMPEEDEKFLKKSSKGFAVEEN